MGKTSATTRNVRPLPIFVFVGLSFVAAAWTLYLGPEDDFSVYEVLAGSLLSVGFAVLTVVILQGLWGLLGGEPIERTLVDLRQTVALVEDAHRTGLHQILTKSGSFGSESDWLEELRRAGRNGHVDLMGYTLASWVAGDFRETVRALLDRGVQVRALIMDPNNPLFAQRSNPMLVEQSLGRLREDVSAVSATFDEMVSHGRSAGSGSFEYRRVTVGSIKWQMTRVDGHMLLVPYMYSAVGSSCPLLRVAQTADDDDLFASFRREFDTLWKVAGNSTSAAPTPATETAVIDVAPNTPPTRTGTSESDRTSH